MTLDLDCVRDILLEAEKCKYNETLPVSLLAKRLTQYCSETIRYNCLKLYEAGYIEAVCIHLDNSPLPYIHEIIDITYPGHEFLSNIRKPENWEKAKDIGNKIGAFGLNMAEKIAEGVATAYLKQALGIY